MFQNLNKVWKLNTVKMYNILDYLKLSEIILIKGTSLDAIVFSLKLKFKTLLKIFYFAIFIEIFFEIFKDLFGDFVERFLSSNLGFLWFNYVVYQVSTFYYVWNWSKSLCAVVGGCKPIIVLSLYQAEQ